MRQFKFSSYILSTGRSGTTILAQCLSANPSIVCRDVFPFETRASQHLFLWAENGKSDDYMNLSIDSKTKANFRLFLRDDELSKDWWQSKKSTIRGKRVIDLVDDYYSFIKETQNKPKSITYLEKAKGLSTLHRMHSWGWPLYPILLIRDPRDILLSVKAFNAKRMLNGFGAANFTDAELVNMYSNFFLSSRALFKNKKIAFSEVHYNALMENPEATLAKVAKEANLDSSPTAVELMLHSFRKDSKDTALHITQKDKNSTSRWKGEANDRLIKIFKNFDHKFKELGYETT